MFTDASGSIGWGGVVGDSVLGGRWSDIHEADMAHAMIAAKETRAVTRVLELHFPDLLRKRVLIRTDNMATLAAINRGAARWPGGREEVMAIASLAVRGGFSLRAIHVAGADNPADAPSRGHVALSARDFTFMHFHEFALEGTSVDCCAAPSGYNAQPACEIWFSAQNPVQLNVRALVGRVLWAAPPWDIAGQVLDAIVAAWRLDPRETSAAIVLPFDPSRSWFRFYFRKPRPIFRIGHMFPAGTPLYFRAVHRQSRFPFKPASAVSVPVMVVYLQG